MALLKDFTGQKIEHLKVICIDRSGKRPKWKCLCDCGKEIIISGTHLTNRQISCGCIKEGNSLHKKIQRKRKRGAYGTYHMMLRRCYNEKDKNYHRYGKRNIKVCDRWRANFDNFLQDMGERPTGYSIERIDNDKGYCKENCKWATRHEQSQNKKRNILIEYRGKKITAAEFWRKTGKKGSLVACRNRIIKGDGRTAMQLTQEEVIMIRNLYHNPYTATELARKLKVDPNVIYSIVKFRQWKNV